MSDLLKVVNFAIKAHDGQERKGGGFDEPYICHPIRVAIMVADLGSIYTCSALLHDVLEDTNRTEEDIRNLLNGVVMGIDVEYIIETVKALTLREGELKIDAIHRLESAPYAALIIKMADMIDNYERATPERKAKHRDRAHLLMGIVSPRIESFGSWTTEVELYKKLKDVFA